MAKVNKEENQGYNEQLSQLMSKDFQAIITGIFPNTRYFDVKFDHLQVQINELRRNQELFRDEFRDFKKDVDYRFNLVDRRFEEVNKRFEQVDKRFEQVDKRFEQVDKRFDQVDKRFEQIIASIDKLSDKLDNRDTEQRNFTMKMFSISIAISILGVLGAFLKVTGIL